VAFAFAQPLLEVMGDLFMAWMLLWRAVVAAPRAAASPFHDGQVKSAAYFIRAVLPITLGRIEALALGEDAALTMSDKGFGG
jgi:hypothetical protein